MGMIQHRNWTAAASTITNDVPRGILAIAGLYFLSSASAFFWAYVPRQMSALGWTGVQIGAFFMLKTAGQAMATPAWSRLADGGGQSGRRLLKWQFVVAAAAIALLPVADSWTVGIVIALVLGTTMLCSPPLMDTMALGTVGMKRFGRVRAVGTMGFGVAALSFGMVGLLVDHGTLAAGASWAMLALVVLSLPIINRLPDHSTNSGEEPRPASSNPRRCPPRPLVRQMLKSPLVLFVFPMAALFVATHIPYELFLVGLAEERGFGAWIPGVAIFVGILGELLGFLSFRKMVKKVSPEILIGAIIAITGLRWMVTGITTSPVIFVGLQVLHGLTFAAFFMAMIEVMARHWGPSPGATSHGLLYLFVFAAGRGVGTLSSGFIYEKTTAVALFWQAGLVTFIILPWMMTVLYLARRYLTRPTAILVTRSPRRRFHHYPIPVPHRRPVRITLNAKAVGPLLAHRRPHHHFPFC